MAYGNLTKHLGAAAVAAGIVLASASFAHAQWTVKTKCYYGTCTESVQPGVPGTSLANIIQVPGPANDEERREAAERDKRWVSACKPTLRQDRLGMVRYQYALPGCEFGRGSE
jgi:hypothetical protein